MAVGTSISRTRASRTSSKVRPSANQSRRRCWSIGKTSAPGCRSGRRTASGFWCRISGNLRPAADGTVMRELGIENAACAFAATELYCFQATPSDGRHPLVALDFDGKVVRNIGSVAPDNMPQTSFEGLRLSLTPDGAGITYSIGRASENLAARRRSRRRRVALGHEP